MKKLFIIFMIFTSFISNASENLEVNLIEFDNPLILPDQNFIDVNSKEVSFEELEGELVLAVFWATWCTTCAIEMKELDHFAKKVKGLKLKIIPISQDFKGIEIVKSYYKKMNLVNLGIYLDPKSDLFRSFNIVGVPTTVIINPKGKEVARLLGNVDWSDDRILELLQKYTNNSLKLE